MMQYSKSTCARKRYQRFNSSSRSGRRNTCSNHSRRSTLRGLGSPRSNDLMVHDSRSNCSIVALLTGSSRPDRASSSTAPLPSNRSTRFKLDTFKRSMVQRQRGSSVFREFPKLRNQRRVISLDRAVCAVCPPKWRLLYTRAFSY